MQRSNANLSLDSSSNQKVDSEFLFKIPTQVQIFLITENRNHTVIKLGKNSIVLNEKINLKDFSQAFLNIFGQQIQIKLTGSSELENGFYFELSSIEFANKFHSILKDITNGKSLTKVNPNILREKYKSGNWIHLRGQGPIDFKFELEKEEKLSQFYLRFLEGSTYQNLDFLNGNIMTSKSYHQMHDKEKIEVPLQKKSSKMIFRGACILSGLFNNEDHRNIADQTLKILEKTKALP